MIMWSRFLWVFALVLYVFQSVSATNRIVSLSPVASEIIAYLGESSQLVGIDNRSEYLGFLDDVALVGSSQAPNLRKILAVSPNIVIGVGDQDKSLVYRLRAKKIQTLVFPYPDNFDGLYELMIVVGQMLGKKKEAMLAVRDLKDEVEAVRKTQPKIKPRVLVVIDYPPIIGAAPRTFIGKIIDLAGGLNIVDPGGEFYTKIRVDYLMRKNPEVVLVTNPNITGKLVKGSPVGVTNAAKRKFVIDQFDNRALLVPSPRFIQTARQFQTYFSSYVARYY